MVIGGVQKVGMTTRCLLHPNQNVCPLHTDSPDFDRSRRCAAYSVIARLGLFHLFGAQKKQYMRAQLAKAGTPGPKAIGIDKISIRKGHTYRIVVSDLIRARPIRFGGEDRSEKSMA